MHYCRALRFENRPNYENMRKLFRDLMAKMNYKYDYVFDWSLIDPPKRTTDNNLDQNARSEQTQKVNSDKKSSAHKSSVLCNY